MEAIETLMTEHRLIERTLDALVAFADEVHRSAGDGREELARFATFIREFADAHHHGKEEDILFATMVEAGFPRHGGPIAVMLMEHDQGRAYVRALSDLAGQQAAWSGADRQRLGEAAHGYANLLRAHIHKEDAILYPMAEQRLPAEALGHIDAACIEYEARRVESGELARLTALAGELHARHPSLAGEVPPHRLQAGGCC